MEISQFFCGQGEKSASGLFAACSFARHLGGRAEPERKDAPLGPAKRVRMGRIAVEGLHDFRRGLGHIFK
ncbi:hypothetical protein SAMN04488514_1162 [Kriegella aquimaris]|uniref:Uncharacterized protein n=1 Tax=Kriegella aquimaris TaxID=192904 RepID=A0A1G9WNT8_9FLAO|nr:hypothetical protein SAMN04488514_1162 [Kriegella aquimaris]